MMSRAPVAWAMAGLWAVVVLSLGGDSFSADQTSRIIGPIVRFLLPHLSDAEHARVVFSIRKAAHVVEYAGLALLSLRAIRLTTQWRSGLSVLACIALVSAVASLDEFRQGLSGVRTGSLRDIGLDLSGAVLALAALLSFECRSDQRWLGRVDGREP